MEKKGIAFVTAIGFLILLGFVIPFTLLTNVDAWYGSFLFWSVLLIAVIGLNVGITRGWRD